MRRTLVFLILLSVNCFAQTTWYRDFDCDMKGSPLDTTLSIICPNGYVNNKLDCNDSNYNQGYKVSLGLQDFSSANAEIHAMTRDNLGRIIVLFRDAANSNKASVMRYNGTSWNYVGNAGFTSGTISSCTGDIWTDALNSIYIAVYTGGNLTIMKHDGINWTTWGNTEPVSLLNGNIIFRFSSKGTAFAYYVQTDKKVIIKKFANLGWIDISPTLFPAGMLTPLSIAIDSSDYPSVAFSSTAVDNKLICLKYDGILWNQIGNTPYISDAVPGHTSIAVNSNDRVYVAYEDSTVNYAITVKVASHGSWNTVGTPGFTSSATTPNNAIHNLRIGADNKPYFTYINATHTVGTIYYYCDSSWNNILQITDLNSANPTPVLAFDSTGFPLLGYSRASSNKLCVYRDSFLTTGPSKPIISGNKLVTASTPNTLTLTGSLNDATRWVWYKGGCGNGTPLGTGDTIIISQTNSTTYYVRGEGYCAGNPGLCDSFTVTTVGIGHISKEKSFTLYPNPVNGNKLDINFEQAGNYNISIQDITGKELKTSLTKQSAVHYYISVEHLNKGMYILYITDEDNNKIGRVKFLRQ